MANWEKSMNRLNKGFNMETIHMTSKMFIYCVKYAE